MCVHSSDLSGVGVNHPNIFCLMVIIVSKGPLHVAVCRPYLGQACIRGRGVGAAVSVSSSVMIVSLQTADRTRAWGAWTCSS